MAESFGRCFLPGPAEVHPDVLLAIAQATGPVSPEDLQAGLRDLFRTSREVMLLLSSATGMMEAAIRCGVEERVLVIIGGEYGERFARIAQACGKDVVRAMVPAGRTLEAEHLAQFLDGPEVDAVALVHAETSTGALTPLSDLARVIRARRNVHILVDAAGSLAGCPVETDQWELDFVFSGCQKALALPPGLALGVVSGRLLARAAKLTDRGWYFDLVRLAQSGTASLALRLPQHTALAAQLTRIAGAGGIEARWKRHHELLKLVEEWVLVHPGLEILAPEGRRAWTASCLRLPEGLASDQVVSGMKDRGWMIGQGYGDLARSTVCIGHMGDVEPAQLAALLNDLAGVLAASEVPNV